MIRRLFSTLPPSTSSKPRESLFRKILRLSNEQQENAFVESTVAEMHLQDRLSRKEWTLIYRDVDGTRSQFFTGIGVPVVLGVVAFGAYDVLMHDEKDQMKFFNRLIDDGEELGLFAAIPITLGALVVTVLARLHTLRIYRIYQNKKVPDEYISILPKMGLRQEQMAFKRETACVTMPSELTDLPKVAYASALGNVILGNRRLMLQDDAFRVNNMRSYMLNETGTPPRLEGL